jgi:hypothetical protein
MDNILRRSMTKLMNQNKDQIGQRADRGILIFVVLLFDFGSTRDRRSWNRVGFESLVMKKIDAAAFTQTGQLRPSMRKRC